jgi:hypothetical protein
MWSHLTNQPKELKSMQCMQIKNQEMLKFHLSQIPPIISRCYGDIGCEEEEQWGRSIKYFKIQVQSFCSHRREIDWWKCRSRFLPSFRKTMRNGWKRSSFWRQTMKGDPSQKLRSLSGRRPHFIGKLKIYPLCYSRAMEQNFVGIGIFHAKFE